MSLDKQRILSELGSVMNQLQSADCGCMGKLFSNHNNCQNKFQGNAMESTGPTGGYLPTCRGCRHGTCAGHGDNYELNGGTGNRMPMGGAGLGNPMGEGFGMGGNMTMGNPSGGIGMGNPSGGMGMGNPCRGMGMGNPVNQGMGNFANPGNGGKMFGRPCNPKDLYSDTYGYLSKNLMNPIVKEVYDDLKSISPHNTIGNNPIATKMRLPVQNNPGTLNATPAMINPYQMNGMRMGDNIMKVMNSSPKQTPATGESIGQPGTVDNGFTGTNSIVNQMAPQMSMADNLGTPAHNTRQFNMEQVKKNIFPNTMKSDLGFDPMAIALQMNPANQQKAAIDTMQDLLYNKSAKTITQPAVSGETTNSQFNPPQNLNQYPQNGMPSQQPPTMTNHQAITPPNQNAQIPLQESDDRYRTPQTYAVNQQQHLPIGQQQVAPVYTLMTQPPTLQQKIPADQQQVIPNPNQQQMVSNPNQQQMVQNPNQQQFLPSPNQQQTVANPNQQQMVPNPNQQQMVQNSNPQQMIQNPNQQLMIPNPNHEMVHIQNQQQMVQNPNQQTMVHNPNQQQMSNPNQQQIAPNPNQQQMVQNPNRQQMVQNPNQQQMVQNPNQQQMVQNPIQLQMLPDSQVKQAPQQQYNMSNIPNQQQSNQFRAESSPYSEQPVLTYNTIGQPVTLMPASYNYESYRLPQTLSPQKEYFGLMRNKKLSVKNTESKTSIMGFGNGPAGTPSQAQLQKVYKIYKSSSDLMKSNRQPLGFMEETVNSNKPLIPIETLGGDTIANNQGEEPPAVQSPKDEGDVAISEETPVLTKKKTRNGLQDMVFSNSNKISPQWTFSGSRVPPVLQARY